MAGETSTPGLEGHVRLSRGELAGIFVFWTLMALLSVAGAYLDPRPRFAEPLPGQVALPFFQYYLWALLTPLIFRLAGSVGIDRSRNPLAPVVLLLTGLLIAIFADALVNWIRLEFFAPPLRRRAFARMAPGPMAGIRRFWFLDDFVLYLAVLGAGLVRVYSLRLRHRHEETVRLQAEAVQLSAQLTEARMLALRTQLNPHFLFNTLHAVSSLVERDPKGVRRMIARLSELLRHTLEGADGPETTLARELELTQRYLEIMEVRFQGALSVDVRVPPGLGDALVPSFILQPLVENAIKHGVGELTGAGELIIEATRDGHALVLRVLDNGPGLRAGREESGVGLRNTRERLQALYGVAQRLEIGNRSEGGAMAEVRLPYHTTADLHAVGAESGA